MTLTVDEQSWARAAFDWTLRGNTERMECCLGKLSPTARREVVLAADTLLAELLLTAAPPAQPGYASGRVRVEPVPPYVEGVKVGTR